MIFLQGFFTRSFKINMIVISLRKFTVSELSTSRWLTLQEEWRILPENETREFEVYDDQIIFDKNFVVIQVLIDDFVLMILNLATQKKFWIQPGVIEEKIFAKITDVDIDGEPFDFEDMAVGEWEIRQMKVRSNRIEIKYNIITEYYSYDYCVEL